MIYNAPTWVNNQSPALNAANLNELSQAVEQDGIDILELQTQQANPYTFKGTVSNVSDLPVSGNDLNDTYYVSAEGCMYTWTGSAWQQSSVNANDYSQELNEIKADITNLQNQKAPTDSPSFSGTPTAPTAEQGTSTNQVATTEFVASAIAELRANTILIGEDGKFYVESEV